MQIPEEIMTQLYTLEEALVKCFGSFEKHDDGRLTVNCCGTVKYGSGVLGTDIAYCEKCNRR